MEIDGLQHVTYAETDAFANQCKRNVVVTCKSFELGINQLSQNNDGMCEMMQFHRKYWEHTQCSGLD